jgi:hypothetical protein
MQVEYEHLKNYHIEVSISVFLISQKSEKTLRFTLNSSSKKIVEYTYIKYIIYKYLCYFKIQEI